MEKIGEDRSINHPAYTEEGAKAIINLVSDEEAFDYPNDMPMKSEDGVILSDYVPACKRLMYVYDFGDDWRHQIDVIRVIEHASYNYPFCLDGLGDAPPEDVGGEGGYLEFLKIINNPKDPDYDFTKQWARGQLYRSFDRDFLNIMLRDQ